MEIDTTEKTGRPVSIEVTEKYKITADKFGWNIHVRQKSKETGDWTTWKQEYYLPTCAAALRTLEEILLRNYPAKSMEELVQNSLKIQKVILTTASVIKMLDNEGTSLTVREIREVLAGHYTDVPA